MDNSIELEGTEVAIVEGKTEQQNRFIELRAEGLSYAKIATELRISKGTLTLWNKELSEKIAELKAVRLNELYNKYFMLKEARISKLGETFLRLDAELERRDLSDVPTDKLLDQKIKYLNELKAEHTDPPRDVISMELNARTLTKELFGLLERLKTGAITAEQADREGYIIATTLKAYQSYVLEEKIDTLRATINPSGDR